MSKCTDRRLKIPTSLHRRLSARGIKGIRVSALRQICAWISFGGTVHLTDQEYLIFSFTSHLVYEYSFVVSTFVYGHAFGWILTIVNENATPIVSKAQTPESKSLTTSSLTVQY